MDAEDALSVVEFLTEEGDLRKQLRTADGSEYPHLLFIRYPTPE